MKNDGRGMSPKEQRKLADDLGRTVQWLRTIGIKPKSTRGEIVRALETYADSLIGRKFAIDIIKGRTVGVIADLCHKWARLDGINDDDEWMVEAAS